MTTSGRECAVFTSVADDMTLPRRGCSFLAVLRYASAESAASVAGFYKVDFFTSFRHSQDDGPVVLDGIRTRTHDKRSV
jgi:hypothetical protein